MIRRINKSLLSSTQIVLYTIRETEREREKVSRLTHGIFVRTPKKRVSSLEKTKGVDYTRTKELRR